MKNFLKFGGFPKKEPETNRLARHNRRMLYLLLLYSLLVPACNEKRAEEFLYEPTKTTDTIKPEKNPTEDIKRGLNFQETPENFKTSHEELEKTFGKCKAFFEEKGLKLPENLTIGLVKSLPEKGQNGNTSIQHNPNENKPLDDRERFFTITLQDTLGSINKYKLSQTMALEVARCIIHKKVSLNIKEIEDERSICALISLDFIKSLGAEDSDIEKIKKHLHSYYLTDRKKIEEKYDKSIYRFLSKKIN